MDDDLKGNVLDADGVFEKVGQGELGLAGGPKERLPTAPVIVLKERNDVARSEPVGETAKPTEQNGIGDQKEDGSKAVF